MRHWIAAVLVACFGLNMISAAQAQSVTSYISRVQIGSDRAGTCYSALPVGYPVSDFVRVAQACGGGGGVSPTPTPLPTGNGGGGGGGNPTPTPTTSASASPGGALNGVTSFTFANPSSCGTAAAPLPAGSDLTGCTAGYLQFITGLSSDPWTYSGYVGPPVVFVTTIADPTHNIGFAAAPTSTGFSLQSVALATGTISSTDTAIVSYLILGNAVSGSASPISVTPSTATVNVGAIGAVNALQAGNGSFTASSSNSDIGNIIVSGSQIQFTGLAAGTSTLTIRGAGQQQATALVTVVAPVSLNVGSANLITGQTQPIVATQAGNATTFTAVSDTPSVATVPAGNVGASFLATAIGPGTANITVTGANGQVARVQVIVSAPAVAPLFLTSSSLSLGVGSSAAVTASQTGNSTFTAASSDATKATVSVSGSVITVTGVAPTSLPVSITVSGARGATSVVAVSVTAQPIALSQTAVTLAPASTSSILVAQLGNSSFSVSSSDPSVATASYASGALSILGISAGTAIITVSGANGQTATVAVTINAGVVSVSQSTLAILAGATGTFNVSQPGNSSFTAGSSNTAVATASVSGSVVSVVGVSAGIANITLTGASGQTAVVAATVGADPVELSQSSLSLTVGATGTVQVMQPGNASFTAISATPGTASASQSGSTLTIVGAAAGTTNVTVSGSNGQTAVLSVTVAPAVVSSITLNPTSQTLANGATGTIAVTYTGGGTLTTTSSNTSAVTATISSNTVHLTAVAPTGGTPATITVTDGTVSATASVVVVANPITLTPSSQTLTNGSTGTIAVSQAGSATKTVSSSNTSAITATISGNTVTLTAVAPTSAGSPVTITVSGGGASATSTVAVTANPIAVNPAAQTIAVGATGSIAVSQANNATFTVSSNSAAVTASISGSTVSLLGVSPTGGTPVVITISGAGSTTTASVSVIPNPISLTPTSLNVVQGATGTFVPTQSGNATFTAASSNTGIATVSISGSNVVVSGVAVGTATITVSGAGATQTGSVTVTPAPAAPITLTSGDFSLAAGSTASFSASQTGNATFTATSDNTSVATASIANGNQISVLGKSVGVAHIAIGGLNNSTSVTATITAGPVSVAPTTATIVAGTSVQIAATEPGNTTTFSGSVTTGSSYASVAPVAGTPGTFLVTGLAPTPDGLPAIITLSGQTGGAVATFSLIVTPAPVVLSAGPYSVVAGQTAQISATQVGNPGTYSVTPSNADATASIATQSASGATFNVNGLAPGNVNLVIGGQGSQSATAALTVLPAPIAINPTATSISLAIGAVYNVTATEAGNSVFSVSPGNSSVQTSVGSNGQVTITALAQTTTPYNVVISGSTGANPVTIAVSVLAPTSITLSPNPLSIPNGGSATFSISQPPNTSFGSRGLSDSTVVSSVQINGTTATAYGTTKGGSAQITITGANGQTAVETLNVAAPVAGGGAATLSQLVADAQAVAPSAACWPMTENVPTIASFANQCGATDALTPTNTTGFTSGATNLVSATNAPAVTFTGPTAPFRTAGITLPTSSPWTVGYVFNESSLTSRRDLFNTGNPFTAHDGIDVSIDTGGQARFALGTGTTYSQASTAAGLVTAGTTHVVFASWDGASAASVSLDCGTPSTTTVSGYSIGVANLGVGFPTSSAQGLPQAFLGTAQMLMEYPTVLTSSQKSTLCADLTGAIGGGSNPPPGAVSLTLGGSTVSGTQTLTAGAGATTYTIVQPNGSGGNYTSGFSVASNSNSAAASATIAAGSNQLVVTPLAAGSTSVVINGNGTASLRFRTTSSGHH